MKHVFLVSIKLYQLIFSSEGFVGRVFGKRGSCRFYPNCSAYVQEAIKKHGIIQGLFLGGKRIIRCHPYNDGGIDLVP